MFSNLNTISKTGSFGEKWHYIETPLYEDSEFNIFINASLESGVIAFSDLRFHRQSCENRDTNILFNNFEQGMAGYKFGSGLSNDFKVFAGKDLKTQIVDHTLNSREGHFFAYDFENGRNTSREILQSNQVIGLDSCVTLWYYIRGNQTLELQVKRPVHKPWGKGDIVYKVYTLSISFYVRYRAMINIQKFLCF